MKRIIGSIFLFLVVAAGGVFAVINFRNTQSEKNPQVLSQSIQLPLQRFKPNPSPSTPVRIEIPSIQVQAVIEKVGLDSKGNMDVPKEDENVGWYELGYKPGEEGSAVVAGHFDTKTGDPAVFYSLSKVQPNDEIIITDETQTTHRYLIQNAQIYNFDEVPLEEIFASSKPVLRLITCDGVYDGVTNDYSKRLIVTAILQNKE